MRFLVGVLGVSAVLSVLAQPWARPLVATTTEEGYCHSWDIWGSSLGDLIRNPTYDVSQSCGEDYPMSNLHGWGFYLGDYTYHCTDKRTDYVLECESFHGAECPEDGSDRRWSGSATANGAPPDNYREVGRLPCDSEQEW